MRFRSLRFLTPLLALAACKGKPAPTRSVAESDRLVPWRYEREYGYVTPEGKSAFSARFKEAARFHEGLAAVASYGGKWGYIDGSGTLVIPHVYDLAGDFKDGKARAFHFKKPILGPVQNLILKPGELTEWTIDRTGQRSNERKTVTNTLPALGEDRPFGGEPRVPPSPPRWKTVPGEGELVGLVEIASGRSVLPAKYLEFRFLEGIDGGGMKLIGARKKRADMLSGSGWSVHDPDGKEILGGAVDVGTWISEGAFCFATQADGTLFWGAADSAGKVVVMPFAVGPFAFRDGIAEASVADLGIVFASRDGRILVDPNVMETAHRAVGRKPFVFDPASVKPEVSP